jgi:hypothetical protein
MENILVLERIENLRGKRAYEEKKAAKLGFLSLYDYLEDKLLREAQANEITKENSSIMQGRSSKKKKQSACSCC